MSHHFTPSIWLLLLLTLFSPLGHTAPPPYWPGYPQSPYFYPPLPAAPAVDASNNEEAEKQTSPPSAEKDSHRKEISLAMQQGNFAEAYYLWRPLAEAGDADAQYGIGWMYHNGYGLAINDAKALNWWELAANQQHVDATFALGMLHSLGEGEVQRDMGLAVDYYHRAALLGHEDAPLLLRTLIAEGDSDARALMLTLLAEGRLGEIAPATQVSSARANVRKGPGTSYRILTTLGQGHKLFSLKHQGRWLLVAIEGKEFTAWIHDSLTAKEGLEAP